MNKEMRQLVAKVRERGWKVTLTSGNHVRFEKPGGGVVFGPSTPSEYRSLRNVIGKLRRRGLDI